MSLQAYQRTAQASESARQTEYRLFAEVTRALMKAAEADPSDLQERIRALDWNRRMWGVLASDCARPENRLPEPLRARIISLSLWVSRHSSAVMRREETFDQLIEVNRIVMQGLSPSPAGSSEAA